jgi:hypothetical protein
MPDWGEAKCIDNDMYKIEADCQQKPLENTQFHNQIVLERHGSEKSTDETFCSDFGDGTVLKKYNAEVCEEVATHSLGYVHRHFTTENCCPNSREEQKSAVVWSESKWRR